MMFFEPPCASPAEFISAKWQHNRSTITKAERGKRTARKRQARQQKRKNK